MSKFNDTYVARKNPFIRIQRINLEINISPLEFIAIRETFRYHTIGYLSVSFVIKCVHCLKIQKKECYNKCRKIRDKILLIFNFYSS